MTWLLATILIAADQATKLWVASSIPLGGPGYTLGLGFHLTHARNTGAAFGILQSAALPLGILSAVVAVAILIYLKRHAHSLPGWQTVGLVLIFSGAVGNMIDRLRLGYVVDFIHFSVPGFDFPVFNIADACIVVGAGLMILAGFRKTPQVPRRQAEPSSSDS